MPRSSTEQMFPVFARARLSIERKVFRFSRRSGAPLPYTSPPKAPIQIDRQIYLVPAYSVKSFLKSFFERFQSRGGVLIAMSEVNLRETVFYPRKYFVLYFSINLLIVPRRAKTCAPRHFSFEKRPRGIEIFFCRNVKFGKNMKGQKIPCVLDYKGREGKKQVCMTKTSAKKAAENFGGRKT